MSPDHLESFVACSVVNNLNLTLKTFGEGLANSYISYQTKVKRMKQVLILLFTRNGQK